MEPYLAITLIAASLALCSATLSNHVAVNHRIENNKSRSYHQKSLTDEKQASPNTRWNYFDLLTVFTLIAFSALRLDVGTDYKAYLSLYSALQPENWLQQVQSSPQEPGFTLFSLALRTFNDSPIVFLWATSALTVLPVFAAVKKTSTNLPMALTLYILLSFFVAPFNIIRQGIAISLSFWANTFIDSNRRAFFALNVLAASFHISAAFVAAFQWVAKRWQPKPTAVFPLIAVAALCVTAVAALPGSANFLNSVNPRYETYLYDEASTAAGAGSYLLIATRLALLTLAVILVHNAQPVTALDNRWIVYVAAGVTCLIIGTQAIVVARLEAYFGIYLILLIPNLIGRSSAHRVTHTLLVGAALVYFYFYLTSYGGLVPYKTYA